MSTGTHFDGLNPLLNTWIQMWVEAKDITTKQKLAEYIYGIVWLDEYEKKCDSNLCEQSTLQEDGEEQKYVWSIKEADVFGMNKELIAVNEDFALEMFIQNIARYGYLNWGFLETLADRTAQVWLSQFYASLEILSQIHTVKSIAKDKEHAEGNEDKESTGLSERVGWESFRQYRNYYGIDVQTVVAVATCIERRLKPHATMSRFLSRKYKPSVWHFPSEQEWRYLQEHLSTSDWYLRSKD